jgi:PNKP adenylyltransferase domain, C-terminal region
MQTLANLCSAEPRLLLVAQHRKVDLLSRDSQQAAIKPLRRVHECVFGVLALESEPVDPRL